MSDSSVVQAILSECLEIMRAKDPSCSLVADSLRHLISTKKFDNQASIEKILREVDSIDVSKEIPSENP